MLAKSMKFLAAIYLWCCTAIVEGACQGNDSRCAGSSQIECNTLKNQGTDCDWEDSGGSTLEGNCKGNDSRCIGSTQIECATLKDQGADCDWKSFGASTDTTSEPEPEQETSYTTSLELEPAPASDVSYTTSIEPGSSDEGECDGNDSRCAGSSQTRCNQLENEGSDCRWIQSPTGTQGVGGDCLGNDSRCADSGHAKCIRLSQQGADCRWESSVATSSGTCAGNDSRCSERSAQSCNIDGADCKWRADFILAGSLTMQVSSASSFAQNPDATAAITEGIANVTGVPSEYIDLDLYVVPERRLNGRELAQTERLLGTYAIVVGSHVPASVAVTGDEIGEVMQASNAAQIGTAISSKVQETFGSGSSVTVAEVVPLVLSSSSLPATSTSSVIATSSSSPIVSTTSDNLYTTSSNESDATSIQPLTTSGLEQSYTTSLELEPPPELALDETSKEPDTVSTTPDAISTSENSNTTSLEIEPAPAPAPASDESDTTSTQTPAETVATSTEPASSTSETTSMSPASSGEGECQGNDSRCAGSIQARCNELESEGSDCRWIQSSIVTQGVGGDCLGNDSRCADSGHAKCIRLSQRGADCRWESSVSTSSGTCAGNDSRCSERSEQSCSLDGADCKWRADFTLAGSLTMQISNVSSFAQNPDAIAAITEGIANHTRVPSEYIDLDLYVVPERRLNGRDLAQTGTLVVTYVVVVGSHVPASVVVTGDEISDVMQASNAIYIGAAITSKVQETFGSDSFHIVLAEVAPVVLTSSVSSNSTTSFISTTIDASSLIEDDAAWLVACAHPLLVFSALVIYIL